MTITAVASQEGGATVDTSPNASRAFGSNVTAGNLVICLAHKDNTTAFLSTNCLKSTGTATISTVFLDKTLSFDLGTSPSSIGIWSTRVTGSGSLNMQVTGSAGTFWVLGTGEYSTDVGWSDVSSTRLETSNTSSNATDNASAAASGPVTSAGGALFAAIMGSNASGAVTLTPDGAFTQIYEEENGATHLIGNVQRRIVSTGTTDTADWTLSGANKGYLAGVAVYKETAGGAAAVNRIRFPPDMSAMGVGGMLGGNRMFCNACY